MRLTGRTISRGKLIARGARPLGDGDFENLLAKGGKAWEPAEETRTKFPPTCSFSTPYVELPKHPLLDNKHQPTRELLLNNGAEATSERGLLSGYLTIGVAGKKAIFQPKKRTNGERKSSDLYALRKVI